MAVVTLPFSLEGKRRTAQASEGLAQLRECVDSVIAIPNDRLLESVARNTPVTEAFRVADDVLRQAVQGISDIITVPGQINLDFADVRAVMKGMGQAVMGTGVGRGREPRRRGRPARHLEPAPRGHLDRGGPGRGRQHHRRARPVAGARRPRRPLSSPRWPTPDANVIYGIVTDESMGNAVKVTVIATGFGAKAAPTPVDLINYVSPAPTASGETGTAAEAGFYRKTPNPKAAAAGGGGRFDLDVPTFLRRRDGEGGVE